MLCSVALSFFSFSLDAQGFGGLVGLKKAKDATLKRMLPATVNLNQKRIKVVAVAASSKQVDPELVTVLRTKLVTLIQKDNRFILDERNPETLLKFTITNFYVESRQADVPGSKPPQKCTMFTGKIESSYQAIEVSTDAPLDSENLEYAISTDGPKAVPATSKFNPLGSKQGTCTGVKATANEARDELADAIVKQMAQRAAPSEQPITVALPGGKLEALSALAMSQRWSTLLEQAEKTDPLPKPEDDAYRTYLIALANEALAYQDAKDSAELEKARRADQTSDAAKKSMAQEEQYFGDAQAYIDKAAKYYKDAIQAKPSEKEFNIPDGRMEEAVRLYATIARHKTEYREAVLKKQQERASGTTPVDTRGAGSTLETPTPSAFGRVIGMCQDHTPDIAQLIQDHPEDLHFAKGPTLDEDLKLKKECGADSKAILDAIRAQTTKKSGKNP
jgi:hypothetical protein